MPQQAGQVNVLVRRWGLLVALLLLLDVLAAGCLSSAEKGGLTGPAVLVNGPAGQGGVFTPAAFFAARLKGFSKGAEKAWVEAYRQWLWRRALQREKPSLPDLALCLCLDPGPERARQAGDLLFAGPERAPGLEKAGTPALWAEYERRWPRGPLLARKKRARALANLAAYHSRLYLLAPLRRDLALARQEGASPAELAPLLRLERELAAFEGLSLQNQAGMDAFLKRYPLASRADLLRGLLFPGLERLYREGRKAEAAALVQRVPAAAAPAFYGRVWRDLEAQCQGKAVPAQLRLLAPWLAAPYAGHCLAECLFQADLVCRAAELEAARGRGRTAALAEMAGAALAERMAAVARREALASLRGELTRNEFFRALVRARAFVAAASLKTAQAAGRLAASARGRLAGGREKLLLQTSLGFSPDRGLELPGPNRAVGGAGVYGRVLLDILARERSNRAALAGLAAFPQKQALPLAALSPDLVGAHRGLARLARALPQETAALARQWLDDPRSNLFRRGRAHLLLGLLRLPAPSCPCGRGVPVVGDSFQMYQQARLNGPGPALASLRKAACGRDRQALLLYGLAAPAGPLPACLAARLKEALDPSAGGQNPGPEPFLPLLQKLPAPQRADWGRRMMNCPSPSWRRAGARLWARAQPAPLPRALVGRVLARGGLLEKAALMALLAQRGDRRFKPEMETWLRGGYFAPRQVAELKKRLWAHLRRASALAAASRERQGQALERAVQQDLARMRLAAWDGLDLLHPARARALLAQSFLDRADLALAGVWWLRRAGLPLPGPGRVLPKGPAQKGLAALLAGDRAGHGRELALLRGRAQWLPLAMLGGPCVVVPLANPLSGPPFLNFLANLDSRLLMGLCGEQSTGQRQKNGLIPTFCGSRLTDPQPGG